MFWKRILRPGGFGPLLAGLGLGAMLPASAMACCSLCDAFTPTFPVLTSHQDGDGAEPSEDEERDVPRVEEPRRSAAPS